MRDGAGDEPLPKGIRTSCFLVADRDVIESEAAQAPYVPRYVDDLEASVRIRDDDPVVSIRAVDPDYEDPVKTAESPEQDCEGILLGGDGAETSDGAESAAASKRHDPEEGDDMTGFAGGATIALPRVFDWLHFVCFSAERGLGPTEVDRREGWRAIHVQTKVAETSSWIRNWGANSGGVSYVHVPFRTSQ